MNKRMKNSQMESVKDVDDRKNFRSDEISIFLQNDQNVLSNLKDKQNRQLCIYSYDDFDSLFHVEGISDIFVPQVRQLLSVKCL